MTKLKPCPFCGGEAQLADLSSFEDSVNPDFGSSWRVYIAHIKIYCTRNGCKANMYLTGHERSLEHRARTAGFFVEDITKAWNKRAKPLTKAKPSTKSPSKKTKEDPHDRIRTRSPCGD